MTFNCKLKQLNSIGLKKLRIGFWVRLRTQITSSPKPKENFSFFLKKNIYYFTSNNKKKKLFIDALSRRVKRVNKRKSLHDGAKAKSLKKGKVGRVGKARPEDAIIDH